MRVRFASLAGLGAAATLFVSGCQGSGAYAQMAENIQNISEKQDQILDKLGQLESKIGQGGGAAPADAKARPRPGRPDPSATYKVPVGEAHTKGPEDAKVTIVEWSDFQCPFCSRVNPTMKQIQEKYGDDVRIAFKHNPLPMHPRATPAAIAAEAAGRQGKFWEMHDKLFANARDLTDENFATWAKEIGLDVEKFKKDMEDPALAKKVKEQQQEGAKLGARGTPAFFVNGRFLSGAQPFDNFAKLIDEELKEAEALIAKGTPKSKVYETVIAKGKTSV